MSDLPSEYQEYVLNAPDVCNNCLATVREERDSLTPTSHYNQAALDSLDIVDRPGDASLVRESYFGRDPRATTVDYFPAETAGDCKQVFCTCGVASAFDRYRSWRDIDRERFKTLIQNLIRSAERKGMTIARHPTAAHALAAYDDSLPHPDQHGPFRPSRNLDMAVDAALADGLLAGLRIGAVRSQPRATPTRAD